MGILVNMVKRFYAKKEEKESQAAPAGERMVLYVPGGSRYHLYDFCLDSSEKEIKKIKESAAIKRGLRLCKKCEKNI